MSLRKFINSIGHFIAGIWHSLLPAFKTAVHIGATVVDGLKTFDENNPEIADIFTAIIPGDTDDKVKAALRAALPKIVIEMRLVDATLGLTDPAEILKAAAKTLQQIEGDWISEGARKNFLDSLAVLIAQVAADGKLSWDDAKYILKWYYDHKEQFKVAA